VFSSGIIDVAIGVFFIYLLLSLVCSSLTEGIARIFALRSSNLKEGIRNLLNDPPEGKNAPQKVKWWTSFTTIPW
jgi:hypothetical protein